MNDMRKLLVPLTAAKRFPAKSLLILWEFELHRAGPLLGKPARQDASLAMIGDKPLRDARASDARHRRSAPPQGERTRLPIRPVEWRRISLPDMLTWLAIPYPPSPRTPQRGEPVHT